MGDPPQFLWRNVLRAIEGAPVEFVARAAPTRPTRLFLSHSTADEARLAPVLGALRRIGFEVFLCGDSIPQGARWWDAIVDALRSADRFVWILSEATARSSWCAFEAGAAVALAKPIQIVGLDGTPAPSFLAHLQVYDLARAVRLRPWLSEDDALVEALCSSPVDVRRRRMIQGALEAPSEVGRRASPHSASR